MDTTWNWSAWLKQNWMWTPAMAGTVLFVIGLFIVMIDKYNPVGNLMAFWGGVVICINLFVATD